MDMSTRVINVEVSLEEAIILKEKGFQPPNKLKLQQAILDSRTFTIYRLHGTNKVFGIKSSDAAPIELIEVEDDDKRGYVMNILPLLEKLNLIPSLTEDDDDT